MRKLILTVLLVGGIAPSAFGFGTIVSEEESGSQTNETTSREPLDLASADVDVLINNGIAVTTIEQTFLNHQDRQREGTYYFPLPKNASISNFAMKIDGEWINGEVLEKKRARDIYESIVHKKKDPGLLEQRDYKTFSVQVFPIPANGKQKIRIQYYQPLPKDSNYRVYTLPMEQPVEHDPLNVGEISYELEVLSEAPLQKVYSPSHDDIISVRKNEDQYFRATAETARTQLDQDFVVAYRLKKEKTRVGVLTTRSGDKPGYFMAVATPGMPLEKQAGGTNYTFLLDASGSMKNGKLDLAKKGLERFLKKLSDTDWFNILRFRGNNRFLSDSLLNATGQNIAQAGEFVETIGSRGDTDLASALKRTTSSYDGDGTLNVVIFSDGIAHDETYLEIAEEARTDVRIFSLGIGNDVSRPLLKSLAEQTGGHADFMSGSGDLNRRVEMMRKKASNPVISHISLDVEGVDVQNVHPKPIPDLFAGQQLLLFGRYEGKGNATVRLSGTVFGKRRTLEKEVTFSKSSSRHKHIERIWAMARIRDLLQKQRSGNGGDNLTDRIVDLGTTYSVVTPYTSFLVLRNEEAYNQRDIERTNKKRVQAEKKARRKARQQARKHRQASRKQRTPYMTNTGASNGANRNRNTNNGTSTNRGTGGGGGAGPIGPFFLLLLSIPLIGTFIKRRDG